jgi:putative membrane protein
MKSAASRRAAWAHDVRRAQRLYQSALPLMTHDDVLNVLRKLARGLRIVGHTEGNVRPAEGERLDRPTQLAVTRTDLALDRSAMATERTLMAWIRTALTMISFGFTLGKLTDALGSVKVSLLLGRTTDISSVAYFLVVLGTLSLIFAIVQNRIESASLVQQGLTRAPRLAFFVAILLSMLGIFVFTDLVTRF